MSSPSRPGAEAGGAQAAHIISHGISDPIMPIHVTAADLSHVSRTWATTSPTAIVEGRHGVTQPISGSVWVTPSLLNLLCPLFRSVLCVLCCDCVPRFEYRPRSNAGRGVARGSVVGARQQTGGIVYQRYGRLPRSGGRRPTKPRAVRTLQLRSGRQRPEIIQAIDGPRRRQRRGLSVRADAT